MSDNHDKQYHIKFVDDHELPEGQDFAFMQHDGFMWLALKRSRLTERVLEDAWAAFREADC